LRVVPDWLSQRKFIRISAEGEMKVIRFENSSLNIVH